ncbi:MAG: hypothetical protein K2Y27_21055 [Xanthobacteraceae bacterium]|nr:hypothetical protein [Xanthobacteraceae bacterium]
MRAINTTIAAIVAVLCVAAFASYAAAQATSQATAQRDAAIERCIAQAHQQFPGNDQVTQSNRVAAYKACMTAAGQAP